MDKKTEYGFGNFVRCKESKAINFNFAGQKLAEYSFSHLLERSFWEMSCSKNSTNYRLCLLRLKHI